MDLRTEEEIDEILFKFLGKIANWNQTNAAKELGIDRRRFNDYYNKRAKPPEALLLEMEHRLRSQGIQLNKDERERKHKDILKLPMLERMAYVIEIEKSYGERRGRQSQSRRDKNLLKCHSSDELKIGRTDAYLAKKYGYSNRKTYFQAKTLFLKGPIEIKEAIRAKKLSIEHAYQWLSFSPAEQEVLLKKNAKEIEVYFKQKSPKKAAKKIMPAVKALKVVEIHADLNQAEAKHQLPLRKTIIGLGLQCNGKNQFMWDLEELQEHFLLVDVPLSAVLDVLCAYHFIEKKRIGKKIVGQILI